MSDISVYVRLNDCATVSIGYDDAGGPINLVFEDDGFSRPVTVAVDRAGWPTFRKNLIAGVFHIDKTLEPITEGETHER